MDRWRMAEPAERMKKMRERRQARGSASYG